MRDYVSLKAAAHHALGAVEESDLGRLEELLHAVTRAVRRDLAHRTGGALESHIARHPLVLLVRARISDLTGETMSWPIPYTSVREAACMLAYPNWKPPRRGRLALETPDMPAPWAMHYLRSLAADYDEVTVESSRPSGNGNG